MSSASFRYDRDSDKFSEESQSRKGSVAASDLRSDRWSVTDRSSRLAKLKEKQREIQKQVDQRKGRPEKESEGQGGPFLGQGGQGDDMTHIASLELSRQSSPPLGSASKLQSPSGGDLSIRSDDQLDQLVDLSMKIEKMGSEISAQQKQLQDLMMTAAAAASQKGLEECMMRMEDQHKIHLDEMHRLQQSFANDSECQGLRVQLDASKQREQSLETQQILLERAWNDEKESLEKQLSQLRSRETTLLQQLQKAIVEVPATPASEEKSEPKSLKYLKWKRVQFRPRIFLGIAAFVGLVAAMTAHFKWRHHAAPHKPPRGLRGPLGRVRLAAHLRG